ncbi:MAG: RNA polymerase sigma factor [Pseudomonadales bacterium]
MHNEQAQQSLMREMDQFLAAQERRAFNMALMATGNRDDALEIVQDSMYKLVQKYSQKDPAHWGPLFTRILQNRIKNWYRRQSLALRWFSRQETSENSPGEQDLTWEGELTAELSSRSPVSDAQQQRFMQALEVALRDLPLRQQQVFLLRAVQGLDVSETANAMSCSKGSVKTHYSRALQKLKQQLAEYA